MSLISRLMDLVSSRPVFGRIVVYGVLAVLGAAIFDKSALYYGLLTLGLLILVYAVAFYLVCYLPLIDLPYLVWRRTGNLFAAIVMILPGLILPVGLPLYYNARLKKTWTLAEVPLPEKPIAVHSILVVGEGESKDAVACGAFCQALLWSGAVDHVLARQSIRSNEHPESATLFVVQPAASCPPVGSSEAAPTPRNGLCIIGSAIPNPSYDAIIAVSQSGGISGLPFHTEQHVRPKLWQAWISDCRANCTPIADIAWETTERLAVPLTLHFERGLDSDFPFGFSLARQPVATNSPEAILRTVFGMDVTGFAPKTGFGGDISRGGPAAPPSRIEYAQRLNEQKDSERMEYIRSYEERRKLYLEKRRIIRASHADCPSPIISPGPEPRYEGCDRNGPPPVEHSFEDVQSSLRH